MPIATGHPNIRNGVEKKTLNAATATPAAITSSHKGTALPGSPTGKETERIPIPSSNPTEIAKIMRPAWTSREAPRLIRAAIRSIAPLSTCGPGTRIMHGQIATSRSDELRLKRTKHAGEQSCTKRLQKSVRAVPRQRATQKSSGCCADHDEHHCFQVVRSEDRRHRSSARGCSERKQPCWSRRLVRDHLDIFKCGADRRPLDSTIRDRRHCRGNTVHVHTNRTAALERNLTASAVRGPQLQLFPVRNHRGS